MEKPIWRKSASAKSNGDFIGTKAYSGYSLAMADPQAEDYLLKPDASDEELGKAVRDSLEQSRALPIEEAKNLRLNVSQNYKDWVQKLMTLYGYKTRRALFKNMKNCSIEIENNTIIIQPSHHEKLEAWDGNGFTEDDYVRISANASLAEIGAGLRLAFSRCTG